MANTVVTIQFSSGEQVQGVLTDEAEERMMQGETLIIRTQDPRRGKLFHVSTKEPGVIINATPAMIRAIPQN